MSSNQRPDTLMQGHVCQIDENLLQRTAGPYMGVIRDVLGRGRVSTHVRSAPESRHRLTALASEAMS